MVIILTTALLSLVGGQYDANLGFIVLIVFSYLIFNSAAATFLINM